MTTVIASLFFAAGERAFAQGKPLVIPGFQPLQTVTCGKSTWILGECEPIAGPGIYGDPALSPDGNNLMTFLGHERTAYARDNERHFQRSERNFALVSWNRITRRPKTVWTYIAQSEEVVTLTNGRWLSQSTYFVFTIQHDRGSENSDGGGSNTELILVDAARGVSRSVDLGPEGVYSVCPAPHSDIVAVTVSEQVGSGVVNSILLYNGAGQLQQSLPFAKTQYSAPSLATWADDENLNVLWTQTANGPSGVQTIVRPDQVNLKTGKVVLQDSPDAVKSIKPAIEPPDAPEPLKLVNATIPATKDVPTLSAMYVQPTTATGDSERTFLAADAFGLAIVGDLNRGEAGVLYISHGLLLYIPLIRAAIDMSSTTKERLHRETIERLAKIRTALRAYARKNGGSPLGAIDLRALLVRPHEYLEDDSPFRDPATGRLAFTYTYSSGLDPNLSDDQNVPIGYMRVNGGRYTLTNREIRFVADRGSSPIP